MTINISSVAEVAAEPQPAPAAEPAPVAEASKPDKATKAKAKPKPKVVHLTTKVKLPKPSKEAKAKPEGVTYRLKELVFKHPELTVNQLIEQLAKKGFATSRSSASTIASDFRHTCRVLSDLGVLTWPPKK